MFISLLLFTSFTSVSVITALNSIGYVELLRQHSTEILNNVLSTPASESCSAGRHLCC